MVSQSTMDVAVTEQIQLSTAVSVDIQEITESHVYNIHQQQLSDGFNNKENTQQLIEILGGIDQILTDYISPNNTMTLQQDQLEQIYEIITNKSDYKSTYKFEHNQIGHDSDAVTRHKSAAKKQTQTITAYVTNTFIYYFFGRKWGEKITNLVYSKTFIFIMLFIYFTHWIWWAISTANTAEHSVAFLIYGFAK